MNRLTFFKHNAHKVFHKSTQKKRQIQPHAFLSVHCAVLSLCTLWFAKNFLSAKGTKCSRTMQRKANTDVKISPCALCNMAVTSNTVEPRLF